MPFSIVKQMQHFYLTIQHYLRFIPKTNFHRKNNKSNIKSSLWKSAGFSFQGVGRPFILAGFTHWSQLAWRKRNTAQWSERVCEFPNLFTEKCDLCVATIWKINAAHPYTQRRFFVPYSSIYSLIRGKNAIVHKFS